MDQGTYPEIARLNRSFSPSGRKMRVCFEIEPALARRLQHSGPDLGSAVLKVCPSLGKHSCRSDVEDLPALDAEHFGNICGRRLEGDAVDVAHLIEHMAIEFVVAITGMPRCSGVTCALREPENRFHVYIECEDASVGSLAFTTAAEALREFLDSTGDPLRFQRRVGLARWIVSGNGDCHSLPDLARSQGLTEPNAAAIVEDLVRHGFIERTTPSINFSGIDYYCRCD